MWRSLKEFTWLSFGQAGRIVSGAIVGVFIARYLGPSQMGIYAFLASTSSIFASVATLGLAPITRRDLSIYNDDSGRIRDSFQLGTGIVSVAMFLVFLLIVPLIAMPEAIPTGYVVLAGIMIISTPLTINEIELQVNQNARLSAIPIVVVSILLSIGKVLLLMEGAGVLSILFLVALEPLLIRVWQGQLGPRSRYRSRNGFELEYFRRSVAEGWPLMVSGLAVLLYMRSDQIMITKILGLSESGKYAVSSKLATMLYFIPTALGSVAMPLLAKTSTRESSNYKTLVLKYFAISQVAGGLIAVALWVATPIAIPLLFGEEYNDAVIAGQIYAITIFFVFVGTARGQVYVCNRLGRYTLFSTAIGALMNIGINIVLIPRYGIVGAAFATVISQIASTVVVGLLIPSTREIGMWQIFALFRAAGAICIRK